MKWKWGECDHLKPVNKIENIFCEEIWNNYMAVYLFPMLYSKSKYIWLVAEFIQEGAVTITLLCPQSNSEKILKIRTGNEVEYNKL